MPCFLANDRDAMFGTSLSRSLCLNTKVQEEHLVSPVPLCDCASNVDYVDRYSTYLVQSMDGHHPHSAFEPLQADLRRYQAAIGVRKLR